MNYRLQQFLSAENITQAQFADIIGVARASVSHIVAGRNKPGFDFISSMARHYPDLSLDWLISGKGRMYKEGSAGDSRKKADSESENTLFDSMQEGMNDESSPAVDSPAPPTVSLQSKSGDTINYNDTPKVSREINQRKINKIVVFYDDNTYQELR